MNTAGDQYNQGFEYGARVERAAVRKAQSKALASLRRLSYLEAFAEIQQAVNAIERATRAPRKGRTK